MASSTAGGSGERREDATGRRADDSPHPGWAAQPQDAYDQADSGGWGGPGGDFPTGPVPRLRPRQEDDSVTVWHETQDETDRGAGVEADESVESIESGGDARLDAPRHDASGHESDGHDPYGADRTGQDRGTRFERFVDAAGFGARIARTLAPKAFWIVLVWLVLDYMKSIYDYSLVAARGGPADAAGMLVLVIVGLFKVVALTCVARLFVELCLDVAALADAPETPDERVDR